MALVPNGALVAMNGNDGKGVEVTLAGAPGAVKALDNTVTHAGKNGGSTLFGLAPVPGGTGLYFVDDGTNTPNLLHKPPAGRRGGGRPSAAEHRARAGRHTSVTAGSVA